MDQKQQPVEDKKETKQVKIPYVNYNPKMRVNECNYTSKEVLIYKINDENSEPDYKSLIPLHETQKASNKIKDVVTRTPLTKLIHSSNKYGANIQLKREDLQTVRSFKIRGAYYKFLVMTEEEKKRGVVCSSAGNHAQGVAYACNKMKVKGNIFMPIDAPDIKVRAVRQFGGSYVTIKLVGESFDDAFWKAQKYCEENNSVFVHAYDDPLVIAGAGTCALEAIQDFQGEIDYFFIPIGGGGLASGMASYIKQMNPDCKIIGCEPFGCPSMLNSIKTGIPSPLTGINTFIDGAAVGTPGQVPSKILKQTLDDIILIPEGICCTSLLEMFQYEGVLCEPAGALSVAALEYYKDEIKGKNVVCVVSGSNNDLTRMTDIKILSEIEQQKRYYILVNFQSKLGAMKEFITDILSEDDEVLSIDYTKKYSNSSGATLVGIQCITPNHFVEITKKMTFRGINYRVIDPSDPIFKFLL